MTHCVYEARAKSRSLNFAALDSPQEYDRFLGDQELLNTPRGIPEFLRRHSLSRALGEYQLVAQQCESTKSIIVTRDLIDLVPRLVAGLGGGRHRLACAASASQAHPVFALWPIELRAELRRALVEEEIRKVDRFTARYTLAQVDFPVGEVDPFFNTNRPEDLEAAERLLAVLGGV